MTPDISILIPAFNIEKYIAAAVASALAQTGVSLEIIVVDDGSEDNTAAVVSTFDDPRIKFIAQQNTGPSVSRNVAIAAATGRYFGFLDGDDLWEPTKALRHVSLMDSCPHLDVTYSWWRVIDENGVFAGRSNTKKPSELPAGIGFDGLLVENFTGTASTLVCRAEAIRAVDGYDQGLRSNVDLDLLLRITRLREGNIDLVPEILTSYRIHATQITSDWRRMQANWEKVIDKMRVLEPQRVARLEPLARARFSRYLAHIAYVRGEHAAARSLLARAWAGATRSMLRDRKSWLTTAAICATYLPEGVNAGLVETAKRIRAKVAAR